MARKIHARLTCAKPLLFAACLLGLSLPAQGGDLRGGSSEGEGCLVLHNQDLMTPFKDNILSFITPEKSLHLLLTSSAYNKDQHRDVVSVSNAEATHAKVRGGNVAWEGRNPFPILVPEGWVTLKLTAEEENITLNWITGKSEVPLVSLTMDYPADNIFLKGLSSVCSEDVPEWEVSEGEEVDVPLDLQSHEQQLEVMGDANGTVYLKAPIGDDFIVTANTTLTLNSTRLDLNSSVEVLFKVDEGTKRVSIEQPPWSRPTVVVGGRRGSTRLRLKRAAPSSPSVSPSPGQSPTSSPLLATPIAIIIVLVVLLTAACTGLVYLLFVTRKQKEMPCKVCRTKGSRDVSQPSEGEPTEAEQNSSFI